MHEQDVIGGTVSALSAALALAAEGVVVRLLSPARFGGGFAAVEVGGRRVELGSRLIELSYGDVGSSDCPPLVDYRPGPHGHRPYIELVDGEVRSLAGAGLVPVEPALVQSGGRRVHDWILDGTLDGAIELMSTSELAAVRAEAQASERTWGRSGWFADPARLWSTNLLEAGQCQTGTTFHHRFIEGFASRLLEGGSSSVVAGLHRKIWMPLFWPGTLVDALRGPGVDPPNRPSWSVAGGGMSVLVDALVDRVIAEPRIEVREVGQLTSIGRDAVATRCGFADGSTVLSDRPIVGVPSAELFEAAAVRYSSDLAISALCWIELPSGSPLPDVMWVLGADEPVIRMSRSHGDDSDRPVVCCELAWWCDERELADAAIAQLSRSGVLESRDDARVLGVVRRPSFAVPSAANRAAFEVASSALAALDLQVEMVGPACEFGADSFNEQLVSGWAGAARMSWVAR